VSGKALAAGYKTASFATEATMGQNPYQSPTSGAATLRSETICQGCGLEAPTRYVEFYQNIGALVMRFHKSVRGNLCKSCINKYFWSYTLTNLTLGWWGMISLVVTPIFILNNVGRYLLCLRMPPVPPNAPSTVLTSDTVARMKPLSQTLIARLQAGETVDTVVHDLSAQSGASPGQVFLYLQALIAQSKKQGQ
jgi:hypothetical protein